MSPALVEEKSKSVEQTQLEEAENALNSKDYPTAKTLFEKLRKDICRLNNPVDSLVDFSEIKCQNGRRGDASNSGICSAFSGKGFQRNKECERYHIGVDD